jgi:hypothetical protein
MRKLKLASAMLLISMVGFFAACQKVEPPKDEEVKEADGSDSGSDIDLDKDLPPNDNSGGRIEATEAFAYDRQLVRTASDFRFIAQRDATKCGGTMCLPTATVIALGIRDKKRPVTKTELDRYGLGIKVVVGSKCMSGSAVNANSFINKDVGNGCATLRTPISNNNKNYALDAGREAAKTFMKESLNSSKPVLILIGLSNSLAMVDTKAKAVVKHWVTLVGLQMTANGDGSKAYYIDPLSRKGEIRTADLTLLLNSMRSASDHSAFNMIAIGCN